MWVKNFVDLKKGTAFLLAVFSISTQAFSEYNQAGIPDSAEIRKELSDEWFNQPMPLLRSKKAEHRTDAIGNLFEIRLEDSPSECAIVISPETYEEVEYTEGEKTLSQKKPSYNKGSAGSWILYKDRNTGKDLRIEWYFANDKDVYLVFRPSEHKTFADLIVYSCYAARSVPLGVDFKNFYSMSFQDVFVLTKKALPWYKVDFSNNDYTEIKEMLKIIQAKLPSINYAENAACDEDGQVHNILTGELYSAQEKDYSSFLRQKAESAEPSAENILTLGEEGFVKWIADGIIQRVTGNATSIAQMLEPTELSYGNPIDAQKKKFSKDNKTKTLDWSRNLAAEAFRVRLPKSAASRDSSAENTDWKKYGVDVSIKPFVSRLLPSGKVVNTAGYVADTGYSIEELTGMLYVLACIEPGWFYLGAIREPSSDLNTLMFNHCAAFFPYFENGHLECMIFQSGKLFTLEEFIALYPKNFIHLERIKSFAYFNPF